MVDALHAIFFGRDQHFGDLNSALLTLIPKKDSAADVKDRFSWKWSANGAFSSRTTYQALFAGTVPLAGAANVWHSFAPMKYKMHAWLALRRRCWTADRLRRRGLQSHVPCPLCTSSDETLDHLSILCPFALQVWHGAIARLDFPLPAPTGSISDWWPAAVCAYPFCSSRRMHAHHTTLCPSTCHFAYVTGFVFYRVF